MFWIFSKGALLKNAGAWHVVWKNLWVIYACCHSYVSSILSSSFFLAKKMWLHIVVASRSNRVMISTLLLLFSIVWKGPVLLIIPFNKKAQKLPGLALRSQWVSSHSLGRETWIFWLVFCQQRSFKSLWQIEISFPSTSPFVHKSRASLVSYLLNKFVLVGGDVRV